VAFGNSASGSSSTFGNVMAVLALFAWAAYFIASKKARETLSTMEYTATLNLVAFFAVLALGLGTGVLFSPEGTLDLQRALLICAVVAVPGTGHIIMNWAHAHTTLMTTSLATLAMPVISTLAALVFLGQEVSGLQVLGIAMVLVTLGFVVVGDSKEVRRLALAEDAQSVLP
jgi:drug/metabolite transporter (DMT)-like permease